MGHLYSAFICTTVPPKALYNIIYQGISPQSSPVCSIHLEDVKAATQRRQCTHHTPVIVGEEREWQGPMDGVWPGHRGYTPTLYEKCHGIFNDHRESGPRFNVSSKGL